MKMLPVMLLAALLSLATSASSQAAFLLRVTSPDDVNHLTVGQTVTFNVDLSGITPGDATTYLSYLAATLQYDNTLLSSFPTITPGAIIPDASNFTGTAFTNQADGFYDSVFGFSPSDPISTNGTFFSFTVKTLGPGNGTISFEADAATFANDPTQTNQFNPDTQGLNFHIDNGTGGVTTTPAPGGLVLVLSGALVGGFGIACRRLARWLPTGQPT
jgi:hypothetical protein